jgi:hypothetical protein
LSAKLTACLAPHLSKSGYRTFAEAAAQYKNFSDDVVAEVRYLTIGGAPLPD